MVRRIPMAREWHDRVLEPDIRDIRAPRDGPCQAGAARPSRPYRQAVRRGLATRRSLAAIDVRLAIDASMMGDEMLLQLQWLRQPASLLRLLERPVWLDAWLRGEEERASLLWRRLPNDLLLHLLKLRAANKRADARRPRLPLYLTYIDRVFLLKPRSWQVFEGSVASYVSMCEECEGQ